MAETVQVYGYRVRQARTIRSSPIKPLAQLLGMSPSAWTALERSASTAMPVMRLRALAAKLRFPHDFFLTPPGGLPVHRGSLLLRAKKTIKIAEIDALTAFAEMVQELWQSLAEHATHPPLRIPIGLPAGTSPEEAARLTRSALDLREDEPIAHVMHTVERAGIPIAVAGVGMPDAKHDAFSVWAGDFHDEPLIVAKPVNSWERTRWSIAHELGHLVMHHGIIPDDAEEQANRFANEFLLPVSSLQKEWPSAATLSTLYSLKQRWHMSLASLIMHGRQNGLLDEARASGLFKQLSARRDPHTQVTWKVQEPGWSDLAPERPRLIAVMVERGLEEQPSARLLSSISGKWADDLMQEVLDGQRPAPAVSRAEGRRSQEVESVSNVIALRRRA
ncbi:ImmA/IrrE family metallo-endopeptidase [Streptomyces sp. 8ZJF_21]|uniref:ImmA/IrrE family metallo-endopeptidase n=1 Tax=Streptomyces sp. 8ZJF_21 TaxID=2903141 RepID=UPI001E4182CC|nr:ImmA/IrrE family metallo-endopeptidase [Streptomyces sp. 8ZJF_21]MCD9593278.1 ImmA/IrrE family metallo-endopeptidase [Streptomyces sp. 8ZJF_21]